MRASRDAAQTASKENEKISILDAPDRLANLKKHGGNLEAAHSAFPFASKPWLDLSTGINPISYPVMTLPKESWQRLPDPLRVRNLEKIATEFYRSSKSAIAGAGSQALIQYLPFLLKKEKNIKILGFTYTGHALAWKASGAEVQYVSSFSDLFASDVAIVVNPNNPDGRLLKAETLLELARELEKRKGYLIVDEAFMDFCEPNCSFIPYLQQENSIVLRSFGKTFGLAGLRLGFAFCGSKTLEEHYRLLIGDWPICGAAIDIGKLALQDQNWFREIQSRLWKYVQRLDKLLIQSGGSIIGGTHLFRLMEHKDAFSLFERLASHGILVRPFTDYPNWLRFGIPYDEKDWVRLENSLTF